MQTSVSLIALALFMVLEGCTPLGESIARKATPEPATSLPNETDPSLLITATNTEALLDPAARVIVQYYGTTIKDYAERYGFDWRLILAIMKQESRFIPTAESKKGASGLMQMMPLTSEEVAKILALEDMDYPRNNIHGGIFYLRQLYSLFDGVDPADRIKLTLAAYNAGIGRVYDAQEVAAYLHDNPTRWIAVKDALMLLSRRYYTLHENVWQDEKPRTGWFNGGRQTVAYVDAIMNYYDEYRLVLN